MLIDDPIPPAFLAYTAATLRDLPPELLAKIQTHISGGQDEQFYQGLCSGLHTARNVVEAFPAGKVLDVLTALTALAASHTVAGGASVDDWPEELEEEKGAVSAN